MDRLKQLAGRINTPQGQVTSPQTGGENAVIQPVESEEQKDTKAAALECLEEQFTNYLHSLPLLTQEEKHKMWNGLISLFLQAFDHDSNNWMMMFPSILPFSIEASKVMVQTIKQKLAGKAGDEARFVVEEFLQWKCDMGFSEGWQLLKTIHLLSVTDSETLQCIVKTGLPLILLKCLHLFFAFPTKEGAGITESQTQNESTVFQETITHIMLNLCSQTSVVEAMVQSDDLRCLLLTVASQWDQCSSSWGKYTGHVLRTISKTLTKNTVRYLHDSDCIKSCTQSLSEMADRSSVYDVSQAAVNVLCFVKDSYQVSPELLTDFENSDGYQLLTTLLLGCDKELEKKEEKPLEELVDFLTSLTIYGQNELKVTSSIAGSQFPNFQFQQPPKSETTVKNLQAFKVLQLVFLKANSYCVSSIILSGISKIWSWNKANFFLLEWTQQTLFQFAEVIYLKPRSVQIQYFQMLRFVVINLSYIPHEVFSRVQAIIRENLSPACALLALECVLDIAKHDSLLTVVFRETRLLEMLLTQLQRYAKILRKAGNSTPSSEQKYQREASCLMLKVVAIMLQGSVKNIVILREYGMIPYIKIFLDDKFYRCHALSIFEQLFVVNAEEYMCVVIGVLCSATQGELMLKLDLLQSLLNVLGIPKARTAFRTAGGFNALQSVLADMEGALCDPPSDNWASVDQNNIWDLIQSTLCTLTVAMHSDPANSYFFRTQGQFDKITDDLRLFGCFSNEGGKLTYPLDVRACRKFEEFLTLAHNSTEDIPPSVKKCVKLFDFLDRMAKDTLPSPCSTQQSREDLPPNHSELNNANDVPEITGSRHDVSNTTEEPSEQLLNADPEDRFSPDPVLVHPGAICVMMDLLPNINCEEIPELSLELQYAVADYVLSLVKSERNRQAMCESGLLTILVNRCKEALADNSIPLHLPLIRVFEKLACQAIDPPILRHFLRLGDPLNCTVGKTQMCDSSGKRQTNLSCRQIDSNETDRVRRGSFTRRGSLIAKNRPILGFSLSHMSKRTAIPRHRVMSLVSMMSSRHFHPTNSCTVPSFTEFDMSVVGYGCCFLPTLATMMGVNAESPVAGGIGDGCRGFPPPVGFTYSSWFMIGSFSSAFDAHPIRFLTLFRHTSKMEKDFTCLSINISAPEKRLVVSTQEEVFEPLDWNESSQTQQSSALTSVEFDVSKYLLVGQWYHLAVVLSKDARRSTTVLAYLNGKVIGTAKIQYIQTFPGMHFSSDSSAVIDVHGIIGTPQIWKQRSSLVWRLGPTYLFEEVTSPETVEVIYQLGPNYLGNFQSVYLPGDDLTTTSVPSALVAEEKVSFGINVMSSAVMTVTDIRNNYNEVDSRLISSELGISSRDDAMPIVLAKNTASHLPGLARTIGAPIASFFGVRTFSSNPAANCLQFIGGPAVILGLVAMASDDHEVYAAVKVLISVLNSSTLCEKEMRRIKGYRLLALLLKKKVRLLNARIFQIILTIVGTMELGRGTLTIWNDCAFRDLLCDFEIWLNAPDTLDLLLFRHFLEILKSSDRRRNAKVMHKLQVVPRLVFLLNDPNNTRSKVHVICTVLAELLKCYFTATDLLRIGLFLTYTLPPTSMNEKLISLERVSDTSIDVINQVPGRTIWLRNQLLKTLLDVCRGGLSLNSKDQGKMFTSLGPDWFLLFMQAHLHPTTVILSTQLVLHFLYNPVLLNKFRDGMAGNVWLENSTAECNILMDNIKSRPQACSRPLCLIPGFEMMQMFLSHHITISQLYLLLAALVLQTPITEMPEDSKLDLDMMINWLLEQVRPNPSDKSVKIPNGLCTEAALVLLEMVRAILNKPISDTDSLWEVTYPGSVMQFFCLVYYMTPNDPLWRSPEFLQGLAAAGFPTAGSFCYVADEGAFPQDRPTRTAEPPPQLPTHPARKQVSDFIHILLVDSFLNIPANKQLHPIEILIEVSPDKATAGQRKSFQTEILLFIMGIFHIISEDQTVVKALIGDGQSATQNTTEGTLTTMLENIVYFSQRFVDKLYARMFDVNPEKILRFLTEQICMVMEQVYPQKDQVLSNLYSSLNRAILYCLSRPRQTPSDLLILLNTLRFLQEQWDIVFATYNSSLPFIICLIHCLCQIKAGSYPDGFGVRTSSKKASWSLQSASNSKDYDGSFEAIHAEEAQKDVMDSVEWVWNHLMSQRRQALEDSYKIDLSVKQKSNENVVDFSEVSPLWEESATKTWHQYIASEKKNLLSKSVSAQLQPSKSEWLPESLSTAVRSVGKRLLKEADRLSVKEFTVSMDVQRKMGQELFASLHKEHRQMQQCILNQASKDWAKIERQLLQERGLWGPSSGSQQDAWILDMAEGPCRMRKKMRRNTICVNYAYNACREKEAKSEVSKNLALNFGNEEFYMKLCSTVEHVGSTDKQFFPENVQTVLTLSLGEGDIDERGMDCNQLTFFPALIESIQPEEFFEDCVERQTILQVLDEKEKINTKYSLIVADGHLLMEGVLLFGRNHFYICENFTLSTSGDVYCVNHHPSSINDSYIYDMCNKETGGKNLKCSRYSYNEVQEIHYLRFLLQDIALEIFLKNGFSKFLIFHKNDRKKIFKKFCYVTPSVKKGKTDGLKSVGRTLGEKAVTQKWQKGEISNFEYLMHLNTLAGRTYNDLMQYPVFPWILADYDSEELDLTNAKTFRDLSKPMGAQTENRKEKFIQRYFEVENDGDLSAQCHYCTHYSSAIIVASYLVRMEPFTQTFCSLQGGSFDVADRMFFSIKKEWESSSRDNMSDVRELIPDFFYLPDFLLNHNSLEFGSMQDGTTLGDVILPPWAKGDAREFVRLQRMALESDYVSAHLHHWIDLIFGYKQQGSAAVEAVNVFHPYFYDDQVDLSSIKDPLKKSTVLGFVSNFGQIPKQLFSKAHPPRIVQGKHSSGKDSASTSAPTLPFFYHLQNLKPSSVPVKELLKGVVGHIVYTEKGVLAVEKNKLLMPPHWDKTFSWSYDDFSCSLGNYSADKIITVFECLSDWGQCLCAVCPTSTTVITGATSSVICVWEIAANKEKIKSMALKEVLRGHIEAVTCLAVSLSYNVIVSGSRDGTCIIWDFNTLTYVSQLQGHKATVSTVSINDLTGDIASCAGTYLYLWTINGQPIASINTSSELTEEILCCCFTEVHEWDSRNVVVTGCADGVVRLWKTEYRRVQVSKNDEEQASEKNGYRWERHLVLCQELSRNNALSRKQSKTNPAVTALAISRNHAKLFVGDSWGRVYSWSVEG
ncbi:WD repeat- and FYVE domain-containing protein 4 isoform X2 [Heterodontus francisci]|uniref:WD repeat- and FYVE domain-containing protein 4 isoform X2 n=1 Tax=Heterodontus francisci TaxID=7792 RepID=UPI00355C0788